MCHFVGCYVLFKWPHKATTTWIGLLIHDRLKTPRDPRWPKIMGSNINEQFKFEYQKQNFGLADFEHALHRLVLKGQSLFSICDR